MRDPNACFVWLSPTGDEEKWRVFHSQPEALLFCDSILDRFGGEHFPSEHWHKSAMAILQYIEDYDETDYDETDYDHVYLILCSFPQDMQTEFNPGRPLGVFLYEKNAKDFMKNHKFNEKIISKEYMKFKVQPRNNQFDV